MNFYCFLLFNQLINKPVSSENCMFKPSVDCTVYEKPKGGLGPGDPIGINLNNLFSTPAAGGLSPAGKIGTGVVGGVVLYEVIKWGAAILLAPETFGGSLGAAAVTP
ncbi:hypothetical protein [Deminuibacter soli]|uniref:hypothetical protein n=1 Tax=Deminuibacter soli TaxID=2291815 RepID=UPI0011C10725|nr:hypothetical protein [Deminuibacter soli]